MLQFMQGFEHIEPMTGTTHLGAAEVQRLLGFDLPVNAANFYSDGTDNSGPQVTDTDARIGGNSLMMVRDAANFQSTDYVDLTYTLASATNRVTIGFAMKFDTAMDDLGVMPLVQFQYGGNEQLSVWFAHTGKLMVGLDEFDITLKEEQTTSAIRAGAETPNGINILNWNYVEVSVDYSNTLPAVKISVNGQIRMDWQQHADFQRQSAALVDKVSLINPINTHFTGDSYTHYIDDVYVSVDGPALGPQHIVLLQPENTVIGESFIGGSITTRHVVLQQLFDKHTLTNYLYEDFEADGGITDDRFIMGDISLPTGGITGVQLFAVAEYDGLQYDARVGYHSATEDVVQSKTLTTDPTFVYHIFTEQGNGDGFSRSVVNSLQFIVGSEL